MLSYKVAWHVETTRTPLDGEVKLKATLGAAPKEQSKFVAARPWPQVVPVVPFVRSGSEPARVPTPAQARSMIKRSTGAAPRTDDHKRQDIITMRCFFFLNKFAVQPSSANSVRLCASHELALECTRARNGGCATVGAECTSAYAKASAQKLTTGAFLRFFHTAGRLLRTPR